MEKTQVLQNEEEEDIFYECNKLDEEQFYDTSEFENIPYDVNRNYDKINHTQLMKGENPHQYIEQEIMDEWLQTL